MVWPPDFVKVGGRGQRSWGNLSWLPLLSPGETFSRLLEAAKRTQVGYFRLHSFIYDLSHALVIKYDPSHLTLCSRFAISVV